ncbi:MAG: radical SAM protein, partial [Thermoleophilia bacterium]|nr:radical SAM protein [Thermoleophilia bacterium]
TIFFAGCNLACVFCQNHTISHPVADQMPGAAPQDGAAPPAGAAAPRRPLRWEVTTEELAAMMLELQAAGCENINFVSPSHVVPQILAALVLAADGGLRLPLVYNTGGYDSVETLRLLDGVIDIYMPDMKYADDEIGMRFSGVPDYVLRNREAVLEMHRQVGDLELGPGHGALPPAGGGRVIAHGVACRGLLVRHLVLPGGLAGTASVARFLASEVSRDTYINVMDQYHPAHRAARYPEISRALAQAEHPEALRETLSAGLWRLDGLDRSPARVRATRS